MRRLLVGMLFFHSCIPIGIAQQTTQASSCPYGSNYSNPGAPAQVGPPPSDNMKTCQEVATIANCYLQTNNASRTGNDFTPILPPAQPDPAGQQLGDLIQGQMTNLSSPDSPQPGEFLATWSRPDQDQATITAINNCILNNNNLCFADSPSNYFSVSSANSCQCNCSTPQTANDSSTSQDSAVDQNSNVALKQINSSSTVYRTTLYTGVVAQDNSTACKVVKELFTTSSCQAALNSATQTNCNGTTGRSRRDTVAAGSWAVSSGQDTQCREQQIAGGQPAVPQNSDSATAGSTL